MTDLPRSSRGGRTHHLETLIDEVERLAAVVAPGHRAAGGPSAPAVEASLALDGCDPAGSDVRMLEEAGLAAALASDDLGPALFIDPLPTLTELHRRLVDGLVEEPGRPRRTVQAVHDASVGRIIHFMPPPHAVPGQLEALARWLTTGTEGVSGLVVSGVLHLELLRIHPFEVANGRLGRTAARLVLRHRGLDPGGLADPEPALAADPLGYHEEVARSSRRRDPTIWLERWGEAVAGGLRAAARQLGLLQVEPPDRARRFLDERVDAAFTLRDYLDATAVTRPAAEADLAAMLDAGRIARVGGGRGLRFTVVEP